MIATINGEVSLPKIRTFLYVCIHNVLDIRVYVCILTYMNAEDYRKLTKSEQLLYLDCLDDTAKFLYWIGKDMHPAAAEIRGLIDWFKYVMSDSYES